MSTPELIRLCNEDQTAKVKNSPHCFDLFQLALVDGDAMAQSAIINQFEQTVRGWVYRHDQFKSCGEDADWVINGAFAQLFQYAPPHARTGKFATLSHCLAYLKRCVHSTIIDQINAIRNDGLWESLDDDALDHFGYNHNNQHKEIERKLFIQEIYQQVINLVQSPQEQLIVDEVWILGIPPRDVYEQHVDLFDSVQAVHNAKRNFTKRIKRFFN